MRAIWKGAVAFGLVNVPVKIYAATGEHEVQLHQVHRTDAGRIRYRRVCSVCGEEVTMAEIAKGYETADGQVVVLTDEDLANLPLATEREIEVLEFVPRDQVDPILLQRTYYLEPERTAAKAYTLLREALAATDRMAVVKVALRQRESMAVLRVRDKVICLQTLLWPDEVRAAEFASLEESVSIKPAELKMASMLVDSFADDFHPEDYTDEYREELQQLIEAKLEGGEAFETPEKPDEGEDAEVVDLLAALQRSVERHKKAGASTGDDSGDGADDSPKKSPRTSSAKTRTKATDETGDQDKDEAKPPTRRRSPARKTG